MIEHVNFILFIATKLSNLQHENVSCTFVALPICCKNVQVTEGKNV